MGRKRGKKSQNIRNKPTQTRKPKRVVARKGGLTLHKVGGSLKRFKQIQQHKLCGHRRRRRVL